MIKIYPGVNGDINVYMDVMRAICGYTEGKNMLDLCCCFAPNTPRLGYANRLYVDAIPRKLDDEKEQQFFMHADVFVACSVFLDKQFDMAICSDGIEHILKDKGYELIKEMQRVSHRQIIMTPTTALFGLAEDANKDPEAHRSLWYPEDFEALGMHTIVFPHYHKLWDSGALFATNRDITNIINILDQKPWANS